MTSANLTPKIPIIIHAYVLLKVACLIVRYNLMFFFFFSSLLFCLRLQCKWEKCAMSKKCAWSLDRPLLRLLITWFSRVRGQTGAVHSWSVDFSSSEATLIPWSAPKRALIAWFNFDPGRKCFYMGHIRDYPLNVCVLLWPFSNHVNLSPAPHLVSACKGASSWFWCVHACKNASSSVAVFCLALCGADVCSGVLLPRGYQHKAVCRPSR